MEEKGGAGGGMNAEQREREARRKGRDVGREEREGEKDLERVEWGGEGGRNERVGAQRSKRTDERKSEKGIQRERERSDLYQI